MSYFARENSPFPAFCTAPPCILQEVCRQLEPRDTSDLNACLGALLRFVRQFDAHSFARCVYFEFGFSRRYKAMRVFQQFIQMFVVAVGVMMEEEELLYIGRNRQRYRIIHATVPPSQVLFIFGGGVLRIENERVRIADKINHLHVLAGTRLGVGKESNQAIRREEPVTDAVAGVMGAKGSNAQRSDCKTEIFEFLDFDIAWQFRKGHWKISAFHLTGQRVDQAGARALTANQAQTAAWIVNGREKRQALDMVPVRVRNQQREMKWTLLELGGQRVPQAAQAGARIQDDNFAAAANFYARGIATVAHGTRSRSRNRAARTPEFQRGCDFNGLTVPHFRAKESKSLLSSLKRFHSQIIPILLI